MDNRVLVKNGNYFRIGIHIFLGIFCVLNIRAVESFVWGRNGYVPRSKCNDAPLEIREDQAEVVLTGTIKKTMPDYEHMGMYKGEIEVQRIVKGDKEVDRFVNGFEPSTHKKMVMVEGFGDTHMCDSEVRVHDTRILLLNKGENGALKLNSSLVRISLPNLDRINKAVNDIPYNPPTASSVSPCDGVFCQFHGVCTVGYDDIPTCNCIDRCRTDVSKVCGTNHMTFNNECELKRFSCLQKTRVNVQYEGPCKSDPCKEYHNCTYPSVCQLDVNRNPVCKCHEGCPETLDLVCGSDGKTYGNPCLLRREACLTNNPGLTINKAGECVDNSPCKNIKCPHGNCITDRNNNAVCKCRKRCVQVVKPVCGSNGMDFDNECELHRFACNNKIDIRVLKEGNCASVGPCSTVLCPENQLCVVDENGSPSCQCKSCTDILINPVCGSNNRTYDSQCALERENCQRRTNVKFNHTGYCAGEGCGRVKKCAHYSFCEGTGSRAKCVCPTNSSCELTEAQVCGSDSKTYHNECFLRVASCVLQRSIYIKSLGECDLCNGKLCKFGAHCEDGECRCPTYCNPRGRPVCANDGKKYPNKCEMERAECINQIALYEVSCSDGEGTDVSPPDGSGDGSGEGSGEVEGSGDEVMEELLICDDSVCPYGGRCQMRRGVVECICDLDCDAIRAPVCGSDGKTYGNLCEMKEEACRTKRNIQEIPMENCNDITEDPCDGNAALVDPRTGLDYNCAVGYVVCPERSYCHLPYGKCCAEESSSNQMSGCWKSRFGCCGDGVTFALGPNRAGCPDTCQCNKYGSVSLTCRPQSGHCHCKPGVGGEKCERCLPKYWGLADTRYDGCKACNCNEFGSLREDCAQNDGKCQCKENIEGLQCDLCPDGSLVYFNLCGLDNELTRYYNTDCSMVPCLFGGYCQQEGNGVVCKCDSLPCLQENLPYSGLEQCGNDGKTYKSDCHMQYQACKEQTSIYRIDIGPCHDAVTPRMDQPLRPRKTTRHIASKVTNMMTIKSTARPPTDSRFTGKIYDICYDDSYCIAEHSQCYLGICQCLDGYIPSMDNEQCSEVKTAMPLETVENLTPCYDNPCRNGGTCELDESLGYRCLCPLGFTGPICVQNVYITSPAFSGKSIYVVSSARDTADDLMFQIGFLTYNKDGIILFASQHSNGTGDFVAVTLNDGILEFRYDLGSGMTVIRGEHELATKQEHKVIVNRIGRKGFLKVNDDPIISAESPGSLTSLDLDGPIYLGNVPDSARGIMRRLGVSIGLAGCISMFQAGQSATPLYYNLAFPQFNGQVISGRDMRQCGSNPCQSMPCKYGGNCLMADLELFQCVCREGFAGSTCETVLDPCVMSQCREGSTCRLDENGYPECICPENMEGEFCEYEQLKKIFVPQFTGTSYLVIPVGEVGSNSLSIRVWFMTSDPNGVIMYASQFPNGIGDYISLNIVSRRIEFRFNMGTSTVLIRSEQIIKLDEWHEVLIQVIGRNGTLLVDNNDNWRYNGRSEGVWNELNLSGSSLYLGGFVNNFSIPLDSGITHNLTGVIQRIYINGHQYDNLMESVHDASGIIEYNGPPCHVNPCLNGGICVPRLAEADCKCPTKYYGQRCEKKADSVNRDLPVDFDGSTYLQYPNEVTIKQIGQRVNRYTIKFRTRNNAGLILFQNGRSNILGDYLAIAIVNGKVELSYNLGKQTDSNLHRIKSIVRVNDGKWHQLMVSRDERAGILQVDNESPVSAESTEGATQLDTNGMIWIGGKTELPLGLPSEYYTGFMGCIKEVLIDNKKLHLFDHRNGQSTSVIKFCQS